MGIKDRSKRFINGGHLSFKTEEQQINFFFSKTYQILKGSATQYIRNINTIIN